MPTDHDRERLISDEEAESSDQAPVRRLRPPRSPLRANAKTTFLPRELQKIHLFSITISTVIGMGFFVRAGTVERVGGPGAVVVASVLVGCLAVAVIQDLARMLRLWPIRSAHVAFIQAFVDEDLAMVAGWLYWLTHCCCFAALSATVGDLVESLANHHGVSVTASLVSALAPIVINLMEIRALKRALLTLGVLKLCIAATIFVIMLCINSTVAHSHRNHADTREVIFQHTGPGKTFGAMGVAIFALCSAFVGIECVAVLAMEANVEQSETSPAMMEFIDSFSMEEAQPLRSDDGLSDKDFFSRTAILVPVVATLVYVANGWIVTENIEWIDDRLPSLDGGTNASDSIFINSARDWSEGLSAMLTFFMIVVAASTSVTTLYVASRSLFGMALIHSGYLDGTVGNSSKCRTLEAVFLFLSKKNKFHVPQVAVICSALVPSLFPFMKYLQPAAVGPTIHFIIELGTLSCVSVWGLESLSHGRLFRCLKRNPNLLTSAIAPWMLKLVHSPWYYFHVGLSFVTALSCFAIIIGGPITTYLHNPTTKQMLPSIIVLVIILCGTLFPKIKKTIITGRSSFAMADLHDDESIKKTFQCLNAQRTANYGKLSRQDPTPWDILGIIDFEGLRGLARRLLPGES